MTDTIDLAFAIRAYYGSNGTTTKALYDHLATLGPRGMFAVNLMRATKTSERAKVYRGRDNRSASYGTKAWSVSNICRLLAAAPIEGVTAWGWDVDREAFERGDPHHHVVYFDIPTGQVSFHMGLRGVGPDYPGEWDGVTGKQADRVLRFIGRLLAPGASSSTSIPAGGEPAFLGA